MKTSTIRLMIVPGFVAFGIFAWFPLIVKSEYLRAMRLAVSGKVVDIQWQSENHERPLFRLRDASGSVVTLNNGELSVEPEQLKIGDVLTKKSGSNQCLINETEIKCVQDYVGFYQMLSNILRNK